MAQLTNEQIVERALKSTKDFTLTHNDQGSPIGYRFILRGTENQVVELTSYGEQIASCNDQEVSIVNLYNRRRSVTTTKHINLVKKVATKMGWVIK